MLGLCGAVSGVLRCPTDGVRSWRKQRICRVIAFEAFFVWTPRQLFFQRAGDQAHLRDGDVAVTRLERFKRPLVVLMLAMKSPLSVSSCEKSSSPGSRFIARIFGSLAVVSPL